MNKLTVPIVFCLIVSLMALLFGKFFGSIVGFFPKDLHDPLYFTAALFVIIFVCLKKNKFKSARLYLMMSILTSSWLLIFSILSMQEVNEIKDKVLSVDDSVSVTGSLHEHDNFNYNYDEKNFGIPRPHKHRALIIRTDFDHVDLVSEGGQNRIRLSCALGGSRLCGSNIKKLYGLNEWSELNTEVSVEYKNIFYEHKNRSLIYKIKSNQFHVDNYFFGNYYKKEIDEILFWCAFLTSFSLLSIVIVFYVLRSINVKMTESDVLVENKKG